MKLSDIQRHLARWYKSGISIHLESAPGRGKSTIIESMPISVGKKLNKNLGIKVVNGAQLTPMHTIGFGVPKHHDGWSEMIFTRPNLMTTDEGKRLEEYDGGILFIDEADKADVDVKKVLGEGALSRRFGPHRLPEGWVIWTAGNRSSDRSGSTKELDHLINRRKRIVVTDDLDSWIDWADANGALPVTKSFAKANFEIVFSAGVPDKQGPWCTPRSLMLVDRDLQGMVEEFGSVPDEAFVLEEMAGLIGDAAAAQLWSHIKLEMTLPKFEDIVAKPDTTPVPTAADARMLICYHVAHQVTTATVEAVIKYVSRLPDPFAVTFCKAAVQRQPMLQVSKPMLAWTRENNALMTLMHSLQASK